MDVDDDELLPQPDEVQTNPMRSLNDDELFFLDFIFFLNKTNNLQILITINFGSQYNFDT